MAKEKPATVRVSLWLTADAATLLDRLAPSPNKRGRYMSDLITQAAQVAGLIEASAGPEGNGEIEELRRQQATLSARIDALAKQRSKKQEPGTPPG